MLDRDLAELYGVETRAFVFIEQGVLSLSAVLLSKVAVEIHIKIIRAFVEIRKTISSNSLLFPKWKL